MSIHKPQTLRVVLVVVAISLLATFSVPAVGKTKSLTVLSGKVFEETSSHRIWQMQRSKRIKTPEDAQVYLQTINQGEYHDWRLPTKHELYDIFSIFDLKNNGDVKIRLEGNYWLADDKGQAYVGAWKIGDQCGPSRNFNRGKAGYIRAVRP